MKRIKWIALSLVVLVIIAVVIVMLSLDSIVRSQVESQAGSSLNLPTTLAGASVSLFGQSLSLSDLQIGSPKGFSAPHMLTLGGAKVGVSISNLRKTPIGVDQITIDKPMLLIEQANGKFNFQAITDQPSKAPADGAEPVKLIIHDLAINNATVVLRPGIPGLNTEMTIPIPTLHLTDIGTGDGNKNGVAIREVVMLTITALAKQASEAGNLPGDLKNLLSINADQLKAQVTGMVDKQIKNVTDNASKAIEKGIGDILKQPQPKQK